jgi:hypothetical protein
LLAFSRARFDARVDDNVTSALQRAGACASREKRESTRRNPQWERVSMKRVAAMRRQKCRRAMRDQFDE